MTVMVHWVKGVKKPNQKPAVTISDYTPSLQNPFKIVFLD